MTNDVELKKKIRCAKTMPYRGLGSGMPRILASHNRVVFTDNKDGNQFTASVSRVDYDDLASEKTSEKETESLGMVSEKTDFTTEKETDSSEKTTEKTPSSIEKTSEKESIPSEKTSEKILEFIKKDNTITAEKIAQIIGISSRAVEYQLKKLQDKAQLRRIGGRKSGHWEII